MADQAFRAKRVDREFSARVGVGPEAVFPLLCPVREREWVRGWDAEVVFSASGVAEDGCVFRNDLAGRGCGTWVVTRHEPPRAVEFAVFWAEGYLERLRVDLAPAPGGGTDHRWRRSYTGLSEEGNRRIEEVAGPALKARMRRLFAELEHFLATGHILAS